MNNSRGCPAKWPFKLRHVPFLITHLGLLLLLAGAISKQLWGVQGVMSLMEGCGGENILVNDSLAIEIKTPHSRSNFPFTAGTSVNGPDNLKMEAWIAVQTRASAWNYGLRARKFISMASPP